MRSPQKNVLIAVFGEKKGTVLLLNSKMVGRIRGLDANKTYTLKLGRYDEPGILIGEFKTNQNGLSEIFNFNISPSNPVGYSVYLLDGPTVIYTAVIGYKQMT